MGKEKKKSKKHKKHKHKKHDSTDSSSSEDEWVEKPIRSSKKQDEPSTSTVQNTNQKAERDEWMNITSLGTLFSNRDKRKEADEEKQKEKEAARYNPKTNLRELNPYWKDGGDGLPTATTKLKFMKPTEEYEYNKYNSRTSNTSNWRKRSPKRSDQEDRWREKSSKGESWKYQDGNSEKDTKLKTGENSGRGLELDRSQERDRKWDNRHLERDKSLEHDRKYSDRSLESDRKWNDRGSKHSETDRSRDRSTEHDRNKKWRDNSPNRGSERNRSLERDRSRENSARNWRRDNRNDKDDAETRGRDYNKDFDMKKDSDSDDSPIVTVTDRFKTSEIVYESKGVFRASDKLDNQKAGSSEMLTDKEMNDIAAKIIKAEILGNVERVAELKQKLERAQKLRETGERKSEDVEVLLTRTDSKGYSKPVNEPSFDQYDTKRKKKAVNTHDGGKRHKYYPDDDKYSLQNMFENEKFGNDHKQEEEFIKAYGKVSKSDDLDDMFMDSIRKKGPDAKSVQKERDQAIREHQRINQSLDNCKNCIQSSEMLKHLMVSLGETVYLSLPPYEPITDGHCLLVPIRHVTCSTQLDENEWTEILDFRKSLTNMFSTEKKTVVFYETAVNLNQYPHMFIHCVPLPEEQGDLAPIYFKKGIDECETEWSSNKKLISMAGKDVRRSVPKGLPFFWVSFGMKEGFAHVIEEQKYFPRFFAEEIIGGILDLHHGKWRRSFPQKFEQQKARMLEFSNKWTKYDCTNKH